MKRSRKLAFIAIVIILLSSVIYLYRIRILAVVWHFRHGYTLAFADYVVPVPANWYPESAGNTNKLLVKLDTESARLHGDRSPEHINTIAPRKAVGCRADQDRVLSGRRVFEAKGYWQCHLACI